MNPRLIIQAAVLTALDLISFIAMRADKRKAIRGRFRISEKTLLLLTVAGPVGTLLAMCEKFVYGRHKNRKWYFWAAAVLGIALHMLIWYAALSDTGILSPSP